MTPHQTYKSDALIFAIDGLARQVGLELVRLAGEDCFGDPVLLVMVGGAGEALRLVHRHDPRLLFLSVGRERLDESVALIGALRSRRPQLPLLAIAAEDDEAIERAVRTAGASYYFTLGGGADLLLLRQTLESLRHPPPTIHRWRQSIRGRPPARIAPP